MLPDLWEVDMNGRVLSAVHAAVRRDETPIDEREDLLLDLSDVGSDVEVAVVPV